MPEAISRLLHDYRNLVRLPKVLERQVARFEQTGESDFEIIRAVVDYCLTCPDLCHHPKQDAVLRRLLLRDPRAASLATWKPSTARWPTRPGATRRCATRS